MHQGGNNEDGKSTRGKQFFLLIFCSYICSNIPVQASRRGNKSVRGQINACSFEREKRIIWERMKSEQNREPLFWLIVSIKLLYQIGNRLTTFCCVFFFFLVQLSPEAILHYLTASQKEDEGNCPHLEFIVEVYKGQEKRHSPNTCLMGSAPSKCCRAISKEVCEHTLWHNHWCHMGSNTHLKLYRGHMEWWGENMTELQFCSRWKLTDGIWSFW